MKKQFICLIVVCMLFTSVASACTQGPDVQPTGETLDPQSVQQMGPREVYEQYLAVACTSYKEAGEKYCHYEDEWLHTAVQNSRDCLISYEILGWEKLSDELWAAKTLHETIVYQELDLGARYAINFVGLVDGRYVVMNNCHQVPQYLKDTVNFSIDEYQDMLYELWGYENFYPQEDGYVID